MKVAENIELVKQKVNVALEKAGRKGPVKIVAVSKTVSPENILQAYEYGQRVFGENRVQEWQKKSILLPKDIEWHLIGRLQTNKIKYLDSRVTLIHSLDRFRLLERLNSEGQKRGLIWKTLVQVNIAKDDAKAGLEVEEVGDFLLAARDFDFVKIEGLMTIGPFGAGQEEMRGYYRELRYLRDKLQSQGLCENLFHLSMGMSQDFEIAVEEGATLIRVGSVIFGERA